MKYSLAVYAYDESAKKCSLVLLDMENFVPVRNIEGVWLDELGKETVRIGAPPLNYSVDRNGVVAMNCGKFSRLKANNCGIVLAKIVSARSNATLGFKVLSTSTLKVVNLREQEIIEREKNLGRPFLQNAIVRGGSINCYPLHEFEVVKLSDKEKKQPKTKTEPSKPPVSEKPVHQEKEKPEFTKEQMKELELCKKSGVNVRLIYNPDLSPEQMRVLWVSSQKGAVATAYAHPDYSVDVMKFYADRLYNNKVAADCKPMLAQRSLPVDELSELYMCVCEGIPYADLVGKPSYEIQVERELRTSQTWTHIDEFENYDKAIHVAGNL